MFNAFWPRNTGRGLFWILLLLGGIGFILVGVVWTWDPFYGELIVALEAGFFGLLFLARKPWIGILLIVAAGPLNDLQRVPSLQTLSLIKVVGLLLAIVWLERVVRENRKVKFTPVGLPFLLMSAVFLVSTLRATASLTASLTAWSTMFSYLLIFLMVVNLIEERWQLEMIVKVSVLVAGAVGVLAVLQFVTGRTLLPTFLVHDVLRPGGAPTLRVVGTAYDPNAGALVPALGLPLALGLYLREESRRWQRVLGLAIALMSFHLVTSFSRSAWIGTSIAVFVLFVTIGYKRISRIALLVLGLLVIAPLFPLDVVILRLEDSYASVFLVQDLSRLSLYPAELQLIRDHWLLGVGLGEFKSAMVSYIGYEIGPHSIPLAVAGRAGILGLGAFLWLFASVFTIGIRGWRIMPERERYMLVGLLSSIIAWQGMGFFNSYLSWIVGWLMVALVVVHVQLESDRAGTDQAL